MIIIQTHQDTLTGIKQFVPNGFVKKLLVENVQLGFGGCSLGFWDRGKEQIVTDSKFIGLNL